MCLTHTHLPTQPSQPYRVFPDLLPLCLTPNLSKTVPSLHVCLSSLNNELVWYLLNHWETAVWFDLQMDVYVKTTFEINETWCTGKYLIITVNYKHYICKHYREYIFDWSTFLTECKIISTVINSDTVNNNNNVTIKSYFLPDWIVCLLAFLQTLIIQCRKYSEGISPKDF